MVTPTDPRPAPPPSPAYLALVAAPTRRLTKVMRRGGTPDVDALSGWEWRGTNLPATCPTPATGERWDTTCQSSAAT